MADLNGDKKINLENLPDANLVRNLDSSNKKVQKQMVIGVVAIIVVGIISGFLLSNITSSPSSVSKTSATGGKSATGKAVGSADTKTFPDSAQGELQAGGVNGEGTHKLLRPGGDSQTVYLTSSVLDLNEFVGKEVKVWGQTFSAKKAGWLMDVGRVEVL